MRYLHYSILLIPVIFTVFAVSGYGFFFRAAVSASCAAILIFMPGQHVNHSIRWIIAALLVSIAGDWFMSHIGNVPVRFIYGVSLFFVAHVGFLCFCLKNGRINLWVLTPVLADYLIFFFVGLRPVLNHTVLFVAVLMYLLVSCFSLAAATGLRLTGMAKWYFTLGILLLVFSDTIIALSRFMSCTGIGFLILPTYFASHIAITMGLMRK